MFTTNMQSHEGREGLPFKPWDSGPLSSHFPTYLLSTSAFALFYIP